MVESTVEPMAEPVRPNHHSRRRVLLEERNEDTFVPENPEMRFVKYSQESASTGITGEFSAAVTVQNADVCRGIGAV